MEESNEKRKCEKTKKERATEGQIQRNRVERERKAPEIPTKSKRDRDKIDEKK